jgi:hypothetical protein
MRQASLVFHHMVCDLLNGLCRQRLTSKSFNCVMHTVALAPAHSVIDTLRRQESHNA